MRLLYVIGAFPPQELGGAEHQCSLQARELVNRGHEVEVLTRAEGRKRESWEWEGVRVTGLPSGDILFGKGASFSFARACGRAVRERAGQVDVVHTHGFESPSAFTVREAHRRGIPSVMKLTGSGPYVPKLSPVPGYRQWLHRQLLKVDVALALNTLAEERARESGLRAEQIHWVPNGFDLSMLADLKPAEVPDKLDGAEPLVVFAGRFVELKQLPLLVQTFQALSGEFPDAGLMLVGDGPQREQLEQMVSEMGLQNRVGFTGWVDEVLPYLAAGDIYCSLSHREGMSNVLLTAMALGKAILVTDIPANRSLIRNDVEGLLTPSKGVEQITGDLRRLMADWELRDRLGEAARDRLEREFTLKIVVDRLEEIYRSLSEVE